jgi:hypothetical protein
LLEIQVSRPVDLSPLASCPALNLVTVIGGSASTGLEILATLPKLENLCIHPPSGGNDLSFLTDCPSLIRVALNNCAELSDLSALVSASRLIYVSLHNAGRLHDLRALNELPDLTSLIINSAPLTGGLAAVIPVIDQLKRLALWSVPRVTSVDTLAGRALEYLSLDDCLVTNLEPLSTLQSLTKVQLRRFPSLNLAPLASLPHLHDLTLADINEPVDLSPLAQTDHRLRLEVRNTPTVGEPGTLVKIRRR